MTSCRRGSTSENVRAYRYIETSACRRLAFFFLTYVPYVLALFYKKGAVSSAISEWAGRVINKAAGAAYTVESAEFIPFFRLGFLSIPGNCPSFAAAVITAVVSAVAVLAIAFLLKRKGPVAVCAIISLSILFISAVYFLAAKQFPYTLTDYSNLYMSSQIVSWIAIGLIMSLSLALYQKAFLRALAAFWLSALYLFVYGCVRYMLYLLFLHKASYLFMAPMFFVIGVFWDFLFAVAIFSAFTGSLGAKYAKKGKEIWRR